MKKFKFYVDFKRLSHHPTQTAQRYNGKLILTKFPVIPMVIIINYAPYPIIDYVFGYKRTDAETLFINIVLVN